MPAWGNGEQAFSPKDGPAAHGPAWSPRGDRLAYKLGEPELLPAHSGNILVVQPAAGGEARQLGSISFKGALAWSPDGAWLAFSTGPYDQPLLKVITIADGSIKDLGNGYDPAWQPSTVQ